MAEHYPATRPAGDVGVAWVDAIAAAARKGEARGGGEPTVALLHAAGFLEDLQVVAYLADRLAERGLRPILAVPRQIDFREGSAYLRIGKSLQPLGAVVRFFQAEWLANRRVARPWREFFRPGRTPILNAPWAILTESKRLPLVWDALQTPMPTWRRYLPETRDPRTIDRRHRGDWILKTAYCNTGDTVCIRELLTPRQWRQNRRWARLFPRQWIAQQRFTAVPIDSPAGPIYPCLGAYTIAGKAAGIYGRYAAGPLIDYSAVDVAVLLESGDEP